MGVLKNEMNNNMFAELGAGVFLFEEFTDMGISGALGYHLKINENIILPVKVRGEIIFDDATNLYVIGLNIGWAFHIGQ